MLIMIAKMFFFTGSVYKLETPRFNVVKRIAYGKSTTYMQEIAENYGQN